MSWGSRKKNKDVFSPSDKNFARTKMKTLKKINVRRAGKKGMQVRHVIKMKARKACEKRKKQKHVTTSGP